MIRANPKACHIPSFCILGEITNKMERLKAAEKENNQSASETVHIHKIVTHIKLAGKSKFK